MTLSVLLAVLAVAAAIAAAEPAPPPPPLRRGRHSGATTGYLIPPTWRH